MDLLRKNITQSVFWALVFLITSVHSVYAQDVIDESPAPKNLAEWESIHGSDMVIRDLFGDDAHHTLDLTKYLPRYEDGSHNLIYEQFPEHSVDNAISTTLQAFTSGDDDVLAAVIQLADQETNFKWQDNNILNRLITHAKNYFFVKETFLKDLKPENQDHALVKQILLTYRNDPLQSSDATLINQEKFMSHEAFKTSWKAMSMKDQYARLSYAQNLMYHQTLFNAEKKYAMISMYLTTEEKSKWLNTIRNELTKKFCISPNPNDSENNPDLIAPKQLGERERCEYITDRTVYDISLAPWTPLPDTLKQNAKNLGTANGGLNEAKKIAEHERSLSPQDLEFGRYVIQYTNAIQGPGIAFTQEPLQTAAIPFQSLDSINEGESHYHTLFPYEYSEEEKESFNEYKKLTIQSLRSIQNEILKSFGKLSDEYNLEAITDYQVATQKLIDYSPLKPIGSRLSDIKDLTRYQPVAVGQILIKYPSLVYLIQGRTEAAISEIQTEERNHKIAVGIVAVVGIALIIITGGLFALAELGITVSCGAALSAIMSVGMVIGTLDLAASSYYLSEKTAEAEFYKQSLITGNNQDIAENNKLFHQTLDAQVARNWAAGGFVLSFVAPAFKSFRSGASLAEALTEATSEVSGVKTFKTIKQVVGPKVITDPLGVTDIPGIRAPQVTEGSYVTSDDFNTTISKAQKTLEKLTPGRILTPREKQLIYEAHIYGSDKPKVKGTTAGFDNYDNKILVEKRQIVTENGKGTISKDEANALIAAGDIGTDFNAQIVDFNVAKPNLAKVNPTSPMPARADFAKAYQDGSIVGKFVEVEKRIYKVRGYAQDGGLIADFQGSESGNIITTKIQSSDVARGSVIDDMNIVAEKAPAFGIKPVIKEKIFNSNDTTTWRTTDELEPTLKQYYGKVLPEATTRKWRNIYFRRLVDSKLSPEEFAKTFEMNADLYLPKKDGQFMIAMGNGNGDVSYGRLVKAPDNTLQVVGSNGQVTKLSQDDLETALLLSRDEVNQIMPRYGYRKPAPFEDPIKPILTDAEIIALEKKAADEAKEAAFQKLLKDSKTHVDQITPDSPKHISELSTYTKANFADSEIRIDYVNKDDVFGASLNVKTTDETMSNLKHIQGKVLEIDVKNKKILIKHDYSDKPVWHDYDPTKVRVFSVTYSGKDFETTIKKATLSLSRSFDPNEQQLIYQAHLHGSNRPDGTVVKFGEYDKKILVEKENILTENGKGTITKAEAKKLIKDGVCGAGNYDATEINSARNYLSNLNEANDIKARDDVLGFIKIKYPEIDNDPFAMDAFSALVYRTHMKGGNGYYAMSNGNINSSLRMSPDKIEALKTFKSELQGMGISEQDAEYIRGKLFSPTSSNSNTSLEPFIKSFKYDATETNLARRYLNGLSEKEAIQARNDVLGFIKIKYPEIDKDPFAMDAFSALVYRTHMKGGNGYYAMSNGNINSSLRMNPDKIEALKTFKSELQKMGISEQDAEYIRGKLADKDVAIFSSNPEKKKLINSLSSESPPQDLTAGGIRDLKSEVYVSRKTADGIQVDTYLHTAIKLDGTKQRFVTLEIRDVSGELIEKTIVEVPVGYGDGFSKYFVFRSSKYANGKFLQVKFPSSLSDGFVEIKVIGENASPSEFIVLDGKYGSGYLVLHDDQLIRYSFLEGKSQFGLMIHSDGTIAGVYDVVHPKGRNFSFEEINVLPMDKIEDLFNKSWTFNANDIFPIQFVQKTPLSQTIGQKLFNSDAHYVIKTKDGYLAIAKNIEERSVYFIDRFGRIAQGRVKNDVMVFDMPETTTLDETYISDQARGTKYVPAETKKISMETIPEQEWRDYLSKNNPIIGKWRAGTGEDLHELQLLDDFPDLNQLKDNGLYCGVGTLNCTGYAQNMDEFLRVGEVRPVPSDTYYLPEFLNPNPTSTVSKYMNAEQAASYYKSAVKTFKTEIGWTSELNKLPEGGTAVIFERISPISTTNGANYHVFNVKRIKGEIIFFDAQNGIVTQRTANILSSSGKQIEIKMVETTSFQSGSMEPLSPLQPKPVPTPGPVTHPTTTPNAKHETSNGSSNSSTQTDVAEPKARTTTTTALVQVTSPEQSAKLQQISDFSEVAPGTREWHDVKVTYQMKNNIPVDYQAQVIEYDDVNRRMLLNGGRTYQDLQWVDVNQMNIKAVSFYPEKIPSNFFNTPVVENTDRFRKAMMSQSLKKGAALDVNNGKFVTVESQRGPIVIVKDQVNGEPVIRRLTKTEIETARFKDDVPVVENKSTNNKSSEVTNFNEGKRHSRMVQEVTELVQKPIQKNKWYGISIDYEDAAKNELRGIVIDVDTKNKTMLIATPVEQSSSFSKAVWTPIDQINVARYDLYPNEFPKDFFALAPTVKQQSFRKFFLGQKLTRGDKIVLSNGKIAVVEGQRGNLLVVTKETADNDKMITRILKKHELETAEMAPEGQKSSIKTSSPSETKPIVHFDEEAARVSEEKIQTQLEELQKTLTYKENEYGNRPFISKTVISRIKLLSATKKDLEIAGLHDFDVQEIENIYHEIFKQNYDALYQAQRSLESQGFQTEWMTQNGPLTLEEVAKGMPINNAPFTEVYLHIIPPAKKVRGFTFKAKIQYYLDPITTFMPQDAEETKYFFNLSTIDQVIR